MSVAVSFVRRPFTAVATSLRASISSPESISSRIDISAYNHRKDNYHYSHLHVIKALEAHIIEQKAKIQQKLRTIFANGPWCKLVLWKILPISIIFPMFPCLPLVINYVNAFLFGQPRLQLLDEDACFISFLIPTLWSQCDVSSQITTCTEM